MSLNILQPFQHVSHRGAHRRSLQGSVNADCVCVLLIDLKHLSHVAADSVAHLEEGSSGGKGLILGIIMRKAEDRVPRHWHTDILDHMILCGGVLPCAL